MSTRRLIPFVFFLFAALIVFNLSVDAPSRGGPGGMGSGGLSPAAAHALDVPALSGYVNDYAGMMSRSARTRVEEELRAFERSDSTQVVILTIPSLQGESAEDYSIKVAEAWKIGQKGKDNGVLLLVANKEHKIRIEVGRGLEGRLTDLTAGQIVDLVMTPAFKRGDFDAGFTTGVSAIIDATRGEFKAGPARTPKKGRSLSPLFTLLIFAGVAVVFLGHFSRILGAAAGALGLPAIVYAAVTPIGLIPIIVLGLIGLGLGLLLSLLFSGGGPFGAGFLGGFLGGMLGGGFFGGGGGRGGDDDGFGGGGGGDFGGGGASGDW